MELLVELIDYLESLDNNTTAFAILIIMLLQSPLLTFPGYIIMIYAGFKLGFVFGSIINFLGLYSSCLIGYRVGKWSSVDSNKVENPKLKRFLNIIDEKGIKAVFFLRILPLIPNNFTSIGSGMAGIHEKPHAVFSLFSVIQSIFWSFLGAFVLKSTISNLELNSSYIHLILLIVLILLLLVVRRKFHSS